MACTILNNAPRCKRNKGVEAVGTVRYEVCMALLTLIARTSDGLPLSASIVDDEVSAGFLGDFKKKNHLPFVFLFHLLTTISLEGALQSIKTELK